MEWYLAESYVDPYEYDADEEYQRDLALGVLD